jgi:hypothetical protein
MQPLLGLGTAWQWLVLGVVGGIASRFWFLILPKVYLAFEYPEQAEGSSFRPDREIERGRS